MVNASQINASPRTVKIGDRELLLSPLSDADVGELEQWIRDDVRRSVVDNLTGLSDAERQRQLDRLYDRLPMIGFMSPEGMAKTITPAGMVKMLWLGLRGNQPDITEAWLSEQLGDPAKLMAAAMDQKELEGEQFPKFSPSAQRKPTKSKRRRR